MTDERAHWQLIKEIFDEADEIPPAQLADFLASRCNGDSALRRQVEELLKISAQTDLAIDRLQVPRLTSPSNSLPSLPRFERGDIIANRYRINRFIASGGMGEVYEATNLESIHTVALKCVRRTPLDTGDKNKSRFLREANLALQIDHPNVCRVFEHFEEHNEHFLAMELIVGETLASRLARENFFSPHGALPIARQLCDGLAAAHAAGVLHRDLKPGNVLITPADRVVIIDFGLAAPTMSDHSFTSTGAVIGTLAYVAPEQLEKGQSSIESDIYSLGVLLYEMLTGLKPHPGKSPFRLAAEKARESHKRPELVVSGFSDMWQEVLDRCLKARPEDRLHSVAEVKALLDRGRPSTSYQAARWWKTLMVPATALAVAALAFAGWTWRNTDRRPLAGAALLYEQAQNALAESSPMRGSQLLVKAIELDPKFVQARALQAVAFSDLDQQDAARDCILEATTAADRRWFLGRGETLMLDAARAQVTRDFKTAADRYSQLAQLTQGRPRQHAQILHARMLGQLGENDKALPVLAAAVQVDPSNAAAHVRYAIQLVRKDRDKAWSEFEAANKAFEASGNLEGLADSLLARSNANLQERNEQYKDMQRVIEISTKTGNRYNLIAAKLNIATVLESRREYDQAIEVAHEAELMARHDNLPVLTTQALVTHGYAFLYRKEPKLAEPILREAVEFAHRTKLERALASARMTWGETLGQLGRYDEQYKAMEPAIAFLRKANNPDSLPVMLNKWARSLHSMGRVQEAQEIFQESIDICNRRDGMEMMSSTAMISIAGHYGLRDWRRQLPLLEQTLALGRTVKNNNVMYQLAQAFALRGDFTRAGQLVAEGDAMLKDYAPAAKSQQLKFAALARLMIATYSGDCGAGLRASKLADEGVHVHLLPLCDPQTRAADFSKHRLWLEDKLKSFPSSEWERPIVYSNGAGNLALALKDWSGANTHALRALEGAKRYGTTLFELEATLILRAAKHGQRQQAEVATLTARVRDLTEAIGFDRPADFNGRADLLRLWRLVPLSK